jgi:hypothetical protein
MNARKERIGEHAAERTCHGAVNALGLDGALASGSDNALLDVPALSAGPKRGRAAVPQRRLRRRHAQTGTPAGGVATAALAFFRSRIPGPTGTTRVALSG